MSALKPFATSGHYVDDHIESGDDIVRATYGAAKYKRLVTLKRDYDPAQRLRMNQNIKP